MLDTKRDLIIFQKKGRAGIIRMIKKQNYYSSFIKNNKNNNNKNYIIVDITVADCQIRAAKPADPFQSDLMIYLPFLSALFEDKKII